MQKLIEQIERDITQIKRRLFYLLEIEKELAQLSCGKPATLKNDIIYQMMWDSYDMVVIDLSSLCRWMKGKGGFFNQLNNHLKKFKRPNPKKIDVRAPLVIEDPNVPPMTQDEYEALVESVKSDVRHTVVANLNAAYDRLFPPRPPLKRKFPFCFLRSAALCTNEQITHEHIQALKNRFDKLTEEIIRDRDARRAHRYEKRKADASVTMHTLKHLDEQFKNVELIVNDVRAITIGGEFLYNSALYASPSIVAQDIADMIFLGSIQMVVNRFGIPDELKNSGASKRFYKQFRDEFYLKHLRNSLIKTLAKKCQ